MTISSMKPRSVLAYSGAERIDPLERDGMKLGAALGAGAGVITGIGMVGLDLYEASRGATRGMQSLAHNPVATFFGAIGLGAALGVIGGFMVGHIQDEGWTIPGAD
jgi:hypothetical protein